MTAEQQAAIERGLALGDVLIKHIVEFTMASAVEGGTLEVALVLRLRDREDTPGPFWRVVRSMEDPAALVAFLEEARANVAQWGSDSMHVKREPEQVWADDDD
jgi:hypothetical protein